MLLTDRQAPEKALLRELWLRKSGIYMLIRGALYRSIALYSIENKLDNESLVNSLDKINIRLEFIDKCQHVFLNDNDVSDKIRTPEVSMGASKVSVIPEVREFLFGLQKKNCR